MLFCTCRNMSRQDPAESKTTRQSVETIQTTNVQSAKALASPDPSTSNVANNEDTTHEKTAFDVSSTRLPADIESMHRKVNILRLGYGAFNPQDGCIDSTYNPPSGDYIYSWSLPSPGISEEQLHEFLDLPETQDISVYPTDQTNQCGSYVPMQARPLLSYTEHQRAIYFPEPPFPAGFDPHELRPREVTGCGRPVHVTEGCPHRNRP